MPDPDRLPRRRRSRILGMTGLMAGVVAVAGVLAWYSDQPRRARNATDVVRKLGGFIQNDQEHDATRPIPPPPAIATAAWLQEQFGTEFAHDLTTISLDWKAVHDDDLAPLHGLTTLQRLYLNGTPITDSALVHIKDLTALERLELRETTITDAGLAHLANLTEMSELYLYGTRITDAGLNHLRGMTKLRKLSLRHTAITDAGLVHLAGLNDLAELALDGTNVTPAGIAKLKRALPRLKSSY